MVTPVTSTHQIDEEILFLALNTCVPAFDLGAGYFHGVNSVLHAMEIIMGKEIIKDTPAFVENPVFMWSHARTIYIHDIIQQYWAQQKTPFCMSQELERIRSYFCPIEDINPPYIRKYGEFLFGFYLALDHVLSVNCMLHFLKNAN